MIYNCRSITPQALLDYLFSKGGDSDCDYILDNIPTDLRLTIDNLLTEIQKLNAIKLKANDDLIKEKDEQIKAYDIRSKALNILIDRAAEYNRQTLEQIYNVECELEQVQDFRRQLKQSLN
jgi:hypothetical protein